MLRDVPLHSCPCLINPWTLHPALLCQPSHSGQACSRQCRGPGQVASQPPNPSPKTPSQAPAVLPAMQRIALRSFALQGPITPNNKCSPTVSPLMQDCYCPTARQHPVPERRWQGHHQQRLLPQHCCALICPPGPGESFATGLLSSAHALLFMWPPYVCVGQPYFQQLDS